MSKSKVDMPKYPLTATIKNGIPEWENARKKISLLKFFEGKRVTFWLEEFSKVRSVQQNRFLWGTVYPIALQGFNDLGWNLYNEDEVHGIFSTLFLTRQRINEVTGDIISFVQSTTSLSTLDFSDYWKKIQQYTAENLNSYIPDPNEFIDT